MEAFNQESIKETTFQGWKAFTLESEQLKMVVIPELGGKMVSLLHKPTSREWLIDSGNRPLAKAAYGSDFEAADMSGWDECFPTIVACPYPIKGDFEGQLLPDHGELWSIPWEASIEANTLICAAAGQVLPYVFTRKIYFLNEQQLRLEYSVQNLGAEALEVFWTAHPQFSVSEQTQIILPKETTQLLCVDGGRFLEEGQHYNWPSGDYALERGLDHIRPAAAQDSRKFYVDGQVDRGWVGLYEEQSGDYLTLKWSPELVPYLGIWINEGQYNGQSVCALEPCNGFYDSLSEAVSQNKLLRLLPGETAQWYLDVKLGCGPREGM